VTRISGPYPHPNALALMTTRCVALGLGWMIFEPGTRRWLAPATLISGLAVIATFSRGAYAGLAGAVLVATPGVSSRLRPAVVAAPFVVILSAIIVARDRMLSLLEGGSGSLRLDLWRSAGAMIRDRPIRGYGPDQFLYAYLPRYVEPTAWQERFTSHAHNYLFDFWVRLGIIGFAFAMVAVIACLVAVVGVVRRPRSFEALRAAGIVALTAVLLHGLVDNAYFSHDLAMSGWLLAWLAFGPVVESAAEGAHKGARPGFGRRWIHRITPVR
jgi:putative inorganic carbon (hco3(-)) transporter